MDIHGILTVQDLDAVGEIIDVAGCDIVAQLSQLHKAPLYIENGFWPWWVGVITTARKIFGPADCHSDVDRGLLDLARGNPFVKAQASVSDDQALTRAHALNSLLRTGHQLGFACHGYVLERERNRLVRTRITRVFLTEKFVHPAQRVFVGKGD